MFIVRLIMIQVCLLMSIWLLKGVHTWSYWLISIGFRVTVINLYFFFVNIFLQWVLLLFEWCHCTMSHKHSHSYQKLLIVIHEELTQTQKLECPMKSCVATKCLVVHLHLRILLAFSMCLYVNHPFSKNLNIFNI